MRRFHVILMCLTVIAIAIFTLCYHFTHRTLYLNLVFSSISSGTWIQVDASRMNMTEGIKLNGYADLTTITDKVVIQKVVDYLNSIPLVSVKGYLDKSTRVFIIPDLLESGYDFVKSSNGKSVRMEFCDDEGHIMRSVTIYNEEYIEDGNYQAFRIRDEGSSIISGLEALEFN